MNLNDMFGLDGRIALVTGGSRGIGKMIVEGYLAAGCARVYISARKSAQIEEAVADFETRYPGKVIGLPVDLSTVEGCRALAKELEAREERLDILVNNAGAAWGEPFEGFPEAVPVPAGGDEHAPRAARLPARLSHGARRPAWACDAGSRVPSAWRI